MLDKLFRKKGEQRDSKGNPYLIRACIGTPEMPPVDYFVALDSVGVQWGEDPKEQKEKGQKNSGKLCEYVLSAIDEYNKRSDSYGCCLGVALIGASKKSGKNISLLSHQALLFEPRTIKKFKRDLRSRISEFMKLSKKGTVDAVIFGGDFSGTIADNYVETVESLNEILTPGTGISPRVISGPNLDGTSGINVFLDTENRRLYITQQAGDAQFASESFSAAEVKEQSLKWQ